MSNIFSKRYLYLKIITQPKFRIVDLEYEKSTDWFNWSDSSGSTEFKECDAEIKDLLSNEKKLRDALKDKDFNNICYMNFCSKLLTFKEYQMIYPEYFI